MKKFRFHAMLLVLVAVLFGCNDEYDDTQLRGDVNDLKSRVEKLEAWCNTANGQFSAMQGVITALEAQDYITGVSPILEGTKEVGYTITFAKSKAVTIRHGANGYTPVISMKKDTDGRYYWTVKIGDGEETWMTDADGNKISSGGSGDNQSPVLGVGEFNGKLYWKVNGEWLLHNGNKVGASGEKGDTGASGTPGAPGTPGAEGPAGSASGITVDTSEEGYVKFIINGDTTNPIILSRTSVVRIFKSHSTFFVNGSNKIILALDIKESFYTAMKAQIIDDNGIITDIQTKAAGGNQWGVMLNKPTFTSGEMTAKGFVLFNTENLGEGNVALLKVSVIGTDGKEHAETRVIKYSTTEKGDEYATLVGDPNITVGGKTTIDVAGETDLILDITSMPGSKVTKVWESDDAAVATVDQNGKVTGVGKGTAAITVTITTEDSEFEKSYNVTVKGAAPAVGDYFYMDGTYGPTYLSDTNAPDYVDCYGVIYDVAPAPSGHTVKVVSKYENFNMAWGPANTLTSAVSESDSRVNQAVIERIPDFATNYPPFKQAATLTGLNNLYFWSVASMNELERLRDIKDQMNIPLGVWENATGGPFKNNYYISSTEKDNNKVRFVDFSGVVTGEILKVGASNADYKYRYVCTTMIED